MDAGVFEQRVGWSRGTYAAPDDVLGDRERRRCAERSAGTERRFVGHGEIIVGAGGRRQRKIVLKGPWGAETGPVGRRRPSAAVASASPVCWRSPLLVSALYTVVCRLLELIVLVGRRDRAKEIEILVLRHELSILRRQVRSPRFAPHDRLLLAGLSRMLPRRAWSVFLVRPETLLR